MQRLKKNWTYNSMIISQLVYWYSTQQITFLRSLTVNLQIHPGLFFFYTHSDTKWWFKTAQSKNYCDWRSIFSFKCANEVEIKDFMLHKQKTKSCFSFVAANLSMWVEKVACNRSISSIPASICHVLMCHLTLSVNVGLVWSVCVDSKTRTSAI